MRVYHFLAFVLLLGIADVVRTQKPSSSSTSDCATKGCSHECKTGAETPLCVCPLDMVLSGDGKTCKDSTSFLLAEFRRIALYREGHDEVVTTARRMARCLDYHYERKELYTANNSSITRYPLSKGKNASEVSTVTQTDTLVTSLAVDWVHDVIYYTSKQESELSVTSLQGGDQRTVLAHNESSTAGYRNVVVDPYAKKLFWIGSKHVYSSNLEGKDLVESVMSWIEPDRIFLDTSSQLIYAIGRQVGSSNKYISKATYNGTKVGEDVEVLQPATVGVFGFGVLGNTAYWESNHDGENLYKCNLQEAGTSSKVAVKAVVVAEVNQIVFDMKLYHRDVQKSPK